MKILALDSAALPASVALIQDDKILSENFINVGLTHSQTLMPLVEQLMKNTNTTIDDIDVIAVTTGPGSFTGVRIGVATVKGIAFGRNIPCVGVSTIETMAYNLIGLENVIICPCMDARCKQVYNALFEQKNGEIVRLCEDRLITIDELEKQLQSIDKKIMIMGDGAKLCLDKFAQTYDNISLVPEHIRYQKASSVAQIAKIEMSKGNYCNDSQLLPQYLRLSQAERERNEKISNK